MEALEKSWLEELAALGALTMRTEAPAQAGLPDDTPRRIHDMVVSLLYSDLARATRLAEMCAAIAESRSDSLSRAFARKCGAHLEYVRGNHERAAAGYEEALRLFDESGDDLEGARTLSSGLQSLILLGRYDQARSWAARAEKIFLKYGDALRLARLDTNVGNIYFRQDQPREAIAYYQRALEAFEHLGNVQDIGAVLSNLAVCHTSLAKFAEAFGFYQRARDVCVQNGLMTLAAQADYNIAYLHYLRGDYRSARELYERCRQDRDPYHSALCDLDEAELLLELNLTHEGELLAIRAEREFAALGMRYEQAKALVNRGVGASQRGDYASSDRCLRKARRLFVEEDNKIWQAMTDLLRAVLALRGHRHRAARTLGSSAWRVLADTPMPGRAAHCQLLLARLSLQGGQADRARAIGRAAIERVGEQASPSLRFHASLLEGEIDEVQGRRREAMQAYEAARREIEDLRSRVDGEDLRISILKDKLAVYDALVSMCLDAPGADGGPERAMLLVQQAKSRCLADRLSGSRETRALSQQDEGLRSELNWCYRKLRIAGPEQESLRLQRRARELEDMLAERRTADGFELEPVQAMSAVSNTLEDGVLLIEYFEARGVLYAFLLDRRGLEAFRLGPYAPVRQWMKLLHFQFGRSQAGYSGLGLGAANHHLGELYARLLAPIETRLAGIRHLIIAPHRNLHGLPFAALHKDGTALIDRFTISTIPSASVFAGCRRRAASSQGPSLIFAVPDGQAPLISEEAALVADLLPSAQLISGSEATVEAFRKQAPGHRFLHLSTHGFFRRDNSLFSSIQLADGRLNTIDLQEIALDAELVALSACSSGSTTSVGGDERLGLIRGFLSAGARNLLVSLWDINDWSTKEFMRFFYTQLAADVPLPVALRKAMLETRQLEPHPYHWAPFILVGGST